MGRPVDQSRWTSRLVFRLVDHWSAGKSPTGWIHPSLDRLIDSHLSSFQLGYNSSANNRERLDKLSAWGEANMPESDKDPAHADLVILLTG